MMQNELVAIIQNLLFKKKQTEIRFLLFPPGIEQVSNFKVHRVRVGIVLNLGHRSNSRLST